MIVMKFGGSSVASAEKIARVIAIVRGRLARKPVIVVSAFRGITDDLLALARESLDGNMGRIEAIIKRHQEAAAELGVSDQPLEPLFDELKALCRGISLLKELTPRTIDRIASFGERFSSRLIASGFTKSGISAVPIDANEAGLITDDRFGSATPRPEADAALRATFSAISAVPIVTGFIGRTVAGETTTLGRNGSDYSATILGGALNAEEIEIWSDTDGIMTADPRIVPDAIPLSILSFAEACELAHYGGKVLHPHTLIPAMAKNIPVRVLNTFKPDHAGTLVIANPPPTSRTTLKSIAFKRHQLIISASSPRMTSGPGFLARIFSAFARHEVDVDMLATSEVSVSATTASQRNVERLTAELSAEFEMTVEKGQSMICAVGDGIQSIPGMAAEVFSSMRDAGVNVRMISQGASKNNIAFVVDDSDVERAVRALHEQFFSHQPNRSTAITR